MVKAENLAPYFESLGVSSMIARIAAGVQADVEIISTRDGLKQISTTNGLFSRTVVQVFKYGEQTEFDSPLTGGTWLSVDQSDGLKLILKNKDRLL